MMKVKLLVAITLMLALLTGCGGPKKDVSLYILPPLGISGDMTDKLEKSLQDKVGGETSVMVLSSPLYNEEKLIAEIAAGDHGIIVVAKDKFKQLAATGDLPNLDGMFNAADFPEGVTDALFGDDKNPRKESHLYGIPVNQTQWMKDSGFKDKETMVAFLHPRAPNMEKAKQVLKVIAGK